MKRFLKSKVVLSLVALVMIAMAAIPMASSFTHLHAAGPSEKHHPLVAAQVTQQVDPATSSRSIKTTTEAPCTNPTILATLQKGEVVNIAAEVAATNGEDPFNEQNEQEFLKIYDVAGDFIQPVDYLASKIFSFTATSKNDVLKACILPGTEGDGPDGDELGTIAVTITPASAPEPTPIQQTRLAKIFLCLLDVAQVGELVKIVGKGARFIQFEGKVFKVLSYTYTGLSTFVASVQDIKTGQIFNVAWDIFTALPLGSCLDLIRDLTPIRPVS